MRPAILLVCLSLVLAVPAAPQSDLFLKLGGIPAQVDAGESVTISLRAISYNFIEPDTVQINGNTITIDLFFFGCPITCGPDLYDYQVEIGELPPGEYTVEATLEGKVLGTREFEVVE